MKHKFFAHRAPAPPVLAVVALLLTVGVVATMPFTWAKYTASGTVAGWKVEFTAQPVTTAPIVYVSVNSGTASYYSGVNTRTFAITSTSQVAARVTTTVRYSDTLGGTVGTGSPEATVAAGNQALAANISVSGAGVTTVTTNKVYAFDYGAPTGTYTITAKAMTPFGTPTEILANRIRNYRIFFDAEQVD